uniref:Endonuclease/exonuclease/phosphatase domain-containing protein n=1 Tax=Cacopsylla melanoneura TaxID=428564 RepID=A0A8D8RVQ3_9HEMI
MGNNNQDNIKNVNNNNNVKTVNELGSYRQTNNITRKRDENKNKNIYQNMEHKEIRLYHQNIQGIKEKIIRVEEQSEIYKPSIICLTEHFQKKENIEVTGIKGYKHIASYARVNHIRGGSVVYANNNLNNLQIEEIDFTKYSEEFNLECSGMRIKTKDKMEDNIIVLCIYRSTQGNLNKFFELFECILNEINFSKNKVIICGDLNINFLNKEDRNTKILNDILESYNMENLIGKPTRKEKTTIDYIIIGKEMKSRNIEVIENGLSDHTAQCVDIEMKLVNKSEEIIKSRSLGNEESINNMQNELNKVNWDKIIDEYIYKNDSIDFLYENINSKLLTIFNEAFPIKIMKRRNKKPKGWLTEELKEHSFLMNKIYKLMNKMDTENKETELIKCQYDNMKKIHKKNLEISKNKYLQDIIDSNKNQNKTMWSLFFEATGKDKTNRNKISLKYNNEIIEDEKELTKTFGRYFIDSVKDKIRNNLKDSTDVENNTIQYELISTMNLEPTTPQEIRKHIKTLPSNNGVEDIT